MLYMDNMSLEHSYVLEWICKWDRKDNSIWDTPYAGVYHGWRFPMAQSTNDSDALAPDSGLLLFLKRQ